MSPRLLEEGLFEFKKKPGAGFCPVKGCRKDGHKNKMGLCHAHHQYRWRMQSPKKSTYATLRDHARGRGIAFTISFEYWQGITDAHRFFAHESVGRADMLTIDRIDATKGYEPGNLTIITMSENGAKGAREKWLPECIQAILNRKRAEVQEPVEEEEEVDKPPF